MKVRTEEKVSIPRAIFITFVTFTREKVHVDIDKRIKFSLKRFSF